MEKYIFVCCVAFVKLLKLFPRVSGKKSLFIAGNMSAFAGYYSSSCSDLIRTFGEFKTDFNSGFFTLVNLFSLLHLFGSTYVGN